MERSLLIGWRKYKSLNFCLSQCRAKDGYLSNPIIPCNDNPAPIVTLYRVDPIFVFCVSIYSKIMIVAQMKSSVTQVFNKSV